jgi:hypothetical protein
MRKFGLLLGAICGGILVIGLNAAPAHAQATRTWVSGVGDDANPCSRTAPCKTFAGAISKTAAQGEINVIDPGGFGAVTITKAITIRSDGVEAGIVVGAQNAIIINAGATDQVTLYGLDLEGLGVGLDGVKLIAGAAVYVIKCTIHHFTGNAVNVVSSTAGARVVIKDSILNQNNGGVNVQGNGVGNSAVLIGNLVDSNTSFSVQANGATNSIALITSVLAGSPTGINALNSSAVVAFGPSNVITGAGAPTSSVLFK